MTFSSEKTMWNDQIVSTDGDDVICKLGPAGVYVDRYAPPYFDGTVPVARTAR